MAKRDGYMGNYPEREQSEKDKPKTEERLKSLSITLGRSGLIAVSETPKRVGYEDKYIFLVTKPDVDDIHFNVVLDTSDVLSLISILQAITSGKDNGISIDSDLGIGNGITGLIQNAR